jgi:hypothetical protein
MRPFRHDGIEVNVDVVSPWCWDVEVENEVEVEVEPGEGCRVHQKWFLSGFLRVEREFPL